MSEDHETGRFWAPLGYWEDYDRDEPEPALGPRQRWWVEKNFGNGLRGAADHLRQAAKEWPRA